MVRARHPPNHPEKNATRPQHIMYAQRKRIYISQQPYSIMSSAIFKKTFNKLLNLGLLLHTHISSLGLEIQSSRNWRLNPFLNNKLKFSASFHGHDWPFPMPHSWNLPPNAVSFERTSESTMATGFFLNSLSCLPCSIGNETYAWNQAAIPPNMTQP